MFKYLDHMEMPTANMINYMSVLNLEKCTFLGFIPCTKEHFGIRLDGVHMCAVHLYKDAIKCTMGDDPVTEQIYLERGCYTVVCLYGSDNISYIKRFTSTENAISWMEETSDALRDPSWILWNS